MKDSTLLTITAIASIIILDVSAMFFLHIDGILMSGCIGTICGLVGFKIKELKELFRNDQKERNEISQ